MAEKKMTRAQLVTELAIERAEYETYVENMGHGPEAMQAMVPFIKSAAFKIARHKPVAGIQVSHGGTTFYARIDWRKLAARVERATPTWKTTIRRMEETNA